MIYKAKYKCRYCGEVFNSGFITSDSNIVARNLLHPAELMIHHHNAADYFENPHIGIGDWAGFEVIETEGD